LTIDLEQHLRQRRDGGRKLLVVYLTGGLNNDWLDLILSCVDSGVDAIEIGVPFSDPMIDGVAIQKASQRALEQGANPLQIMKDLHQLDVPVPLVAMTYFNLFHHSGLERVAGWLVDGGISGVIIPDLPLEESTPWRDVARPQGIATVQLVAPSTPQDRAEVLCRESEGFVYGIGLMGTTGERASLADTARLVGPRLKALTTKPVLVGIGISNPDQAAEAASDSDGVIVGSAIVRRVLDGAGPREIGAFVAGLRTALDGR
jgi:tryptophan synthase alpha chain